MFDWRPHIVRMVLIKQEVAEADKAGLWEWRLPAVAATEADVTKAERALGFPFAEQYRNFLHYADGWPALYHDVDLLGTEQLLVGVGMEMLGFIEEEAFLEAGVRPEDLLPIAVSRSDLDLFVLARPSAPYPGQVLWFAGGLIDRFADFENYFLAMQDYNRLQIQRMRGNA